MIYQDWLQTNLLQLLAHTQNSEWFSTISVAGQHCYWACKCENNDYYGCAFAGWSKRAFSPPWKLGLRTKISRKLDVSSSIPINWFISCNDSLLAGTTTHTAQRRTSEGYFTRAYEQGRHDVRWRPGQEASLAPPCSNLRSFGSKCTVLKNVGLHVTLLGLIGAPAVIRRPPQWFNIPLLIRRPANCAPFPPRYAPGYGPSSLGPRRNLYSLFV